MLNTWRYLLAHPLNRARPFAALRRWIGWQIGTRVRPGLRHVPFVDDTQLAITRGMTGATGNLYCGLHEYIDMAFALHLLRAGDAFADVGANVGSYSILAAGACGADVVAFEPLPTAYEALRRNVALNGLDARIRVVRAAAGASAGEVSMTQNLDTMNRVIDDESPTADALRVPCVRLDDELGERPPLLIKIDVEGHEASTLQGAVALLAHPALRALIVELGGPGRDSLRDLLARHGFATYAYDPARRELREAAIVDGGNQLFVRDVAFVRERLRTAPKHHIRATDSWL
jgi:FkbM family methyltransferase